jgi:predicted N-acyltransferase
MDVRLSTSLSEIPASEWQQLTQGSSFPFHDYEYLAALESSGSVGPHTGWQPLYFCLWEGSQLRAASFTYLKTESYGEYIFDWAWANAYQQLGQSYYPKLTTAIPFTPATGSKLLLHPDLRSNAVPYHKILLQEQLRVMSEFQASSYHALFIPESELEIYKKQDMFIRQSFQYHWQNQNYQNFDHFLENLQRKRRNEIRREREALKKMPGLIIRRLEKEDLTPLVAEQMYAFYLSTIEKQGAIPYLKRAFFESVFKTMQDRIVVFFAYKEDPPTGLTSEAPIAGTLNFYKGESLFGRYWGCHEEVRHLHFELCYYQTIEFAIEKKLQLFEAGAQGEHKFSRGFTPALTWSAHKIRDPQLSNAIENFVYREKRQIQLHFEHYKAHWPYKQSGQD